MSAISRDMVDFTNKLVRSINTKTLINMLVTVRVFRHDTDNFEDYFIRGNFW